MHKAEPDFTPKFHVRSGKDSFQQRAFSGRPAGGLKTMFVTNMISDRMAEEAEKLIEQGFKIVRLYC